jgi:hypothetical protein
MSNFGTRLAYPTDDLAPPSRDRVAKQGLLARITAALSRAIDEAPFDLGWPPSPRTYERRRID